MIFWVLHIEKSIKQLGDNMAHDKAARLQTKNLIVVFLELGQKGIAGLLSISEQHVSVLLEEDGIVNSSVADTKGSLHNNDLRK